MTRRVLMLTSGGLENGGGIGRMIGYLLDECRRIAFPVAFTVLDTRGPGAWSLWPYYFSRAMLTVLRAAPSRPVLHIHIAGRGSTLRKFLAVVFGRCLRLPIILHVHDYDYQAFCESLPAPLVTLIRWMFRRACRVIVLGDAAKTVVTGFLGVDPTRVRVLANAVPAPPAMTRDPIPSAEPVHILFLGQLSRRKGVHDLLEALDRPALRRLAWTATLAGGGPHNESFAAQAAATGVAARITLPGWLDREGTTQLLQTADILVLPSYAEGLAMSVLEGMAYGICVICTPVGALPEAITHDADGLLVQPGDIDALATALADCVASAPLRQRLGQAAAIRFSREFDIRSYPSRLAALYREIGIMAP